MVFPLALFPEGGLANSVVTTVWVGVFFVVFFNLRLGWVLSGLVVPGYLAPLILLKPWSAAVILLEGVLTYFIVWFYSEFLSRHTGWSNLFGRDRFFALVLVSVAVRLLLDGWLLPIVGESVNSQLGLQFDYRNNLHSFGLIIVSLVANNFWKSGLWRSILPMAVTVTLTVVTVRYLLMDLTNFSLSNLAFLYEDVASSMLASPKSYIILLAAAFLASRMNLLYGWEFNGILIPSLLALQWYQPMKLLISFAEAGVILAAASLVLRLPFFANQTMEGGRKLLLFFNIGFFWKMALGFWLLAYFPEVKTSDYYGFGYLLPTLVAMRIHDKGILARLTRATLQTSLLAVVFASVVGFLLTQVTIPLGWFPTIAKQALEQKEIIISQENLIDIVREQKLALYRNRLNREIPSLLPKEAEQFSAALRLLADNVESPRSELLPQAAFLLHEVGFILEEMEGRYLLLREMPPQKGWGLYIIDPASPQGLSVETPVPLEEQGAMEAAAWLFRAMSGRSLAIAGSNHRQQNSGDVLADPNTPFHLFHRHMALQNVLQVRSYTPETARILSGVRTTLESTVTDAPPSRLWIKKQPPPGLDLRLLQSLAGPTEMIWDNPALTNLQRDTTPHGFAELFLQKEAVVQIISRSAFANEKIAHSLREQRIDGYLQEWLLAVGKERVSLPGTEMYQPPRMEELFYFDQEILSPLLTLIKTRWSGTSFGRLGEAELTTIAGRAIKSGFQIILYHHVSSSQNYLILADREDSSRHWGTLIFRLGKASDYVIEIPHPLYEVNTFEFGAWLFETLQARTMIIAGSHPFARRDQSADVLQLSNLANMFNLSHQVISREWGNTPLLSLHMRGFSPSENRPPLSSQLVFSFSNGAVTPADASPLANSLMLKMKEMGLSLSFADGKPAVAGLEVGATPQSLYLPQTDKKELGMIWLSPLLRPVFTAQLEDGFEEPTLASLGIPSQTGKFFHHIAPLTFLSHPEVTPLMARMQRFYQNRDFLILRQIMVDFPSIRLQRFVDQSTGQSFLFFSEKDGLLLVANLNPMAPAKSHGYSANNPAILHEFLDNRSGFLHGGEMP